MGRAWLLWSGELDKSLFLVTGLNSLVLLIFSESYVEFLQFSFFDRVIETDVALLSEYCNAPGADNCFYSAKNYIYSLYLSLISALVLTVISFFVSKKNIFDGASYEEVFTMLIFCLVGAPFFIVLALSVPEFNQFPLPKFSSLQQTLGKFWFVLNIICISGGAYVWFGLMQISKNLLGRIRLS